MQDLIYLNFGINLPAAIGLAVVVVVATVADCIIGSIDLDWIDLISIVDPGIVK